MKIDTFTWSEDGMDRNELMTYVKTPFRFQRKRSWKCAYFRPDFENNFVGFGAQDLCLEPSIMKLLLSAKRDLIGKVTQFSYRFRRLTRVTESGLNIGD